MSALSNFRDTLCLFGLCSNVIDWTVSPELFLWILKENVRTSSLRNGYNSRIPSHLAVLKSKVVGSTSKEGRQGVSSNCLGKVTFEMLMLQ